MITRDYTKLLDELKRISEKYNICFSKISYIGYWDPTNTLQSYYTVEQYGLITFKDKYST